MLNFEEFYKEQEWNLVQLWGKLVYQPISAEEFAHCFAKQCYKWYLKGARELMDRVSDNVENYCGSITYCDDCCPKKSMHNVDDELEELENKNAETEEN